MDTTGVRERLSAVSRAEVAVLASGTASMGLEILAGRLVAIEYGGNVFTWGSIIGVFLAALSLGYYRGGKRAKDATHREMTWLLVSSTLFVAFVVFAGWEVVRMTAAIPVAPRYGPLLPTAILFGVPVYLLGFISPYAAELTARESTGEASGRVYALGTVGSIAGAFGTTFVLLPELGVDRAGLVLGSVLLVGAAATLAPSPDRRGVAGVVFAAVVLVAAVVGAATGLAVPGTVVYQTQTQYQSLTVADDDGVRTLYLGGHRHSAMDKSDPARHVWTYTRYFHLPLLMTDTDDVQRVLFIGGGGFTGPKAFQERYDYQVDVVEIDPEVVRVAKEYFRVEEGENLDVTVADGRRYLRQTDRTYDVIVLDAYQRDKVPVQLTTKEFFSLAKSRLDDDGVLLANVVSARSGPASKFLRAEYKTVDRVFPQTYAFPTSDTRAVQNVELVATKHDRRFTEADLLARNDARDVGIDLAGEIRTFRGSLPTGDVPVLTDRRAPVDSLLSPMVGERYVVEQTERPANGTTGSVERPRVAPAAEARVADATGGMTGPTAGLAATGPTAISPTGAATGPAVTAAG